MTHIRTIEKNSHKQPKNQDKGLIIGVIVVMIWLMDSIYQIEQTMVLSRKLFCWKYWTGPERKVQIFMCERQIEIYSSYSTQKEFLTNHIVYMTWACGQGQ